MTVKNICQSFTPKMAAKASWHRNYVTVTRCIYSSKVKKKWTVTVCWRLRSPWKSQSEWQRTGINGESTSMVWPTLGSRTAKEQNRTAVSCGHRHAPTAWQHICLDHRRLGGWSGVADNDKQWTAHDAGGDINGWAWPTLEWRVTAARGQRRTTTDEHLSVACLLRPATAAAMRYFRGRFRRVK